MRILLASPTPPTLTKPRPHHFVTGLAARGHEVHVLAQVASREDAERLDDEPGWPDVAAAAASTTVDVAPTWQAYARCAMALPRRRPLRVAYCASPSFRAHAVELVERISPHVVHVDRERLAPAFRFHRGAKVLDATDAISLYNERLVRYGRGTTRALAVVDRGRMSRFERQMGVGYDSCLVAAEEDLGVLRDHGGCGCELRLVPNGVGDHFFAARPRPGRDHLVFVGNLYYEPNADGLHWFLDEVFPAVRARRPDVRFTIVGADPSPALVAQAAAAGATVTGRVPDVVPHLEEATAFVSPLRIGGGFPNKVAEALAAGVAVVGTGAATAGLSGLVAGRHALVADGAAALADAVTTALADDALRTSLATAGRAFVAERYRWDTALDRLEEAYEASVAARR